MNYIPNNLTITDTIMTKAQMILATKEDLIIRYIRKSPTVGLALVPVRGTTGAILDDIPWKKKQVICHGVPTGCIVAVLDETEALRIGWSRRFDEKQLIETHDLHSLFRSVLDNSIPESSDDYTSRFNAFCQGLIKVMAQAPKKELEISFMKKEGRKTAVLRALADEITVHKRFMQSAASGPMPNDITRALIKFIPQVEEKFDKTAANVIKENMEITVPAETSLTAS